MNKEIKLIKSADVFKLGICTRSQMEFRFVWKKVEDRVIQFFIEAEIMDFFNKAQADPDMKKIMDDRRTFGARYFNEDITGVFFLDADCKWGSKNEYGCE